MNKVIGKYEFNYQNCLGSGSFASVYKGYAIDDIKRPVAIKEINVKKLTFEHTGVSADKIIKTIRSEVGIMGKLNHPNILHFEDVILEGDSIFIVLEYCSGGDIVSYMRLHNKLRGGRYGDRIGVGEHNAKCIATQLMNGLKHMHSKGIVHRDLKPQNILLSNVPPLSADDNWDNVSIKIADFGFARTLGSSQLTTTVCGSPLYMAPEILDGHKYTDTADLWSFGIILYEMLAGIQPYIANSVFELRKLYQSSCAFKMPVNISEDCQQLLTSLLVINPLKRIQWDTFFNHPWFVGTPMHSSMCDIGVPAKTQLVNIQVVSSAPCKIQLIKRTLHFADEDLLKSYEIINDYSRSTIIAKEMQPREKHNDSMKLDLQTWLERIKDIIELGMYNINNNNYIVGHRFCSHGVRVLDVIIGTAETYIIKNNVTQPEDDLLENNIFVDSSLLLIQLKNLRETCLEKITFCENNLTSSDTCKPIDKLIYDKAISLGKQGNVNMEIDNYSVAMDNYTVGKHLLETLALFADSNCKKMLDKYITSYGRVMEVIADCMRGKK